MEVIEEVQTQLGFFPTPDSLVDYMMGQLLSGIQDLSNKRILVPGCGEGQFIRGILRYCENEGTDIPNITGVEIDKERYESCNAEFGELATILNQDFLRMSEQTFELIIGNPPYVAITGISKKDKSDFVASFKSAKGRFDLYFLFWEKSLSMLSESGRITFVTPQKFLYVDSASGLREILASHQISQITQADPRNFPGLAAYPCVTTVERRPRYPLTETKVKRLDGSEITTHLSADQKNWIHVIEDEFVLPDEDLVTLGSICKRISPGPATGRDSLFVRPKGEIPRSLRGISHPTISGRQLVPGSPDFSVTDFMIIPYDREKREPFSEESKVASKLESVFATIDSEGMAEKKKRNTRPWYKFKDSIPFGELLSKKILVKDICASPEFWLDSDGVVPRHTVYYIVPNGEVNILRLLRYLRSDQATGWLRANSQKAQNGSLRIQSSVLKDLPVPSNLVGPNKEETLCDFWSVYYSAIRKGHIDAGLKLSEQVYGRNNYTTNSKHVKILEDYACTMLANILGVERSEVGPRKVRISPDREKSFDCVWPLEGEPKIAISVKSLQSAYRNLVNRYEEAFGDVAIVRKGGSKMAFGFLMVTVDGSVARGKVGTIGRNHPLYISGRASPVPALVEDGGDWLENPPEIKPAYSGKKDNTESIISNLSDMVFKKPEKKSGTDIFPRYDAIALMPTKFVRRKDADIMAPEGWKATVSDVPEELDISTFFTRLVETAKARGLL